MLTSLLTVYIASSISPDFQTKTSTPRQNEVTSEITLTSFFTNSKAPIKEPQQIAPIINAKGSVAIDMKTGTVLYEKNSNTRMPMASITKLMTALIILEEQELSEVVTVSPNANNTGGSTMNLYNNEQITVENLLRGLLINSANDGAVALAEHNVKDKNKDAINPSIQYAPGTTSDFVDKMNKRAIELGLVNTHFANPTGLDHPNNYSSPYDLAKLGNYLYNNKLVKEIAQIKETDVYSISGDYTHHLTSTNELLGGYLHIKGLKTGSTEAAGNCLVSIAENDSGNEILTVVLSSPARFEETKILIDWVFRSYNWQ